jgi:hypothetical protein
MEFLATRLLDQQKTPSIQFFIYPDKDKKHFIFKHFKKKLT